MIYAPLLLLVPFTLISSWWVGSRTTASSEPKVKRLNREYFLGLNYLIENQPDKAIDTFVKWLEVDNETIEIHLILANLFRSRGEVDRAIRVHQNIIARPNLARHERIHALSELGKDYLQAGVLDRAEKLFLDVVDQPGPHKHTSLEYLLCIYEQERDWPKAIATAKKLQSNTAKPISKIIAQYYCELAVGLSDKHPNEAIKQLFLALKANPACVRANLLLGDIYTSLSRYKLAIRYLQKVRDQNDEWLGETTEHLRICYQALEKEPQLIDYLKECLSQSNNVAIVLDLAKSLHKQQGDREAIDFLAQHMQLAPSIDVLSYLVDIYRENSVGDSLEKLHLLGGFIDNLMHKNLPYRCKQCGFTGAALYWQCPGCRGWEVMLPWHALDHEFVSKSLEVMGAV